jgi:hypothetical protein
MKKQKHFFDNISIFFLPLLFLIILNSFYPIKDLSSFNFFKIINNFIPFYILICLGLSELEKREYFINGQMKVVYASYLIKNFVYLFPSSFMVLIIFDLFPFLKSLLLNSLFVFLYIIFNIIYKKIAEFIKR